MNKRKLNYQVDSIERQLESFGNGATVYDSLYVSDINESEEVCRDIVQHYISDNLFKALIVDAICFQDSFKELDKPRKILVEDVFANLEDDDEESEEKRNQSRSSRSA